MLTAQDIHDIAITKDLDSRPYVKVLQRGPKRQVKKELLARLAGMRAKDVAYLILATLQVSMQHDHYHDPSTGEPTRTPLTDPPINTEPYVLFILDHLYRKRRRFFYSMMDEAYRVQKSPALWLFMIGGDLSS